MYFCAIKILVILRKMYRLILSIIIFNMLFHTALGSARSLTDSLENVLKRTDTDTAKVMVYNRFARSFMDFNLQNQDYYLALEFAQKGLALAEQIGFAKGEADIYRTIGNAYYFLNENEKAFNHYEKALKICEVLQDYDCMAFNHYNLALTYEKMSRYFYALDSYQKALLIWKEKGNMERICIVYGTIVQLYLVVGEFHIAERWAMEALDIAIESGNRRIEVILYDLLSRIYDKLGNIRAVEEYIRKTLQIYEELGEHLQVARITHNIAMTLYSDNPTVALNLYRQSAAIYENLFPAHNQLFKVYLSKANIFHTENQADSALYYFEKSLAKAILSEHLQTIAEARDTIGRFFLRKGDLDRAESELIEAHRLAAKSGMTHIRSSALSALSELHFMRGNYETAFDYLKRYKLINDSLNRENNRSNILQLTDQHVFERNQIEMREAANIKLEKQQQALKYHRIVISIICFAFLLTAILLAIIFRSNRQKNYANWELNMYKNNLEAMVEEKTCELTIAKEKA